MKYGYLVTNELIDIYNHTVYEFNGVKVGECSTSKVWNDDVLWFNENVVILKGDE